MAFSARACLRDAGTRGAGAGLGWRARGGGQAAAQRAPRAPAHCAPPPRHPAVAYPVTPPPCFLQPSPNPPPLLSTPHQGDKNYPGGWLFDPLNLSADARRYEAMRVREIKNGRLAMVAWLGFAAQAAATSQGF